MTVRGSLKRFRRSLMRGSPKGYIRLITGIVIVGIFISEGSVRDVSEMERVKVTPKMISHERVDEVQLSSDSETNATEKERRNATESAIAPAKVSRTLHELLQEAIPEQIFGFSSEERNVSHDKSPDRRIHNFSSLLKESSFDSARPSDRAAERLQDAVRYHDDNNSSRTQVREIRTKSQASLNGTDFEKNSSLSKANGHTPFKGVLPTEETKHLFDTDNVTHLSFMLYRLIKTHNIKSVVEVPCKVSMLWIRDLLQVLEFEVPKFHYKCLAPDDKTLAEGVVRFQHLSSATVLKNQYPWASRLPHADLALCWYGLGFLPPDQSWGLLKALRGAGVKFVLVPNYPEVRHNPGLGSSLGRINVRRAPYRFNEPLRVVNNISTQASTPKQLLFYDLEGIRTDSL